MADQRKIERERPKRTDIDDDERVRGIADREEDDLDDDLDEDETDEDDRDAV